MPQSTAKLTKPRNSIQELNKEKGPRESVRPSSIIPRSQMKKLIFQIPMSHANFSW